MGSIFSTSALATKSATITSAAKAISHADFGWTAGHLALAERATITVRTAGVMYTYDGTTPSATVGHLLAVNSNMTITGQANIAALQFYRDASTDAVVTVTLEK